MTKQVGRLGLTVGEFRDRVPMSRNAVYDAIKRGDIPHVRIHGKLLIPTWWVARTFGVDDAAAASHPSA